jgi:hypothetical protein
VLTVKSFNQLILDMFLSDKHYRPKVTDLPVPVIICNI